MSVRNLVFISDYTLAMEKQVNSICKSCNYQRIKGLIHKYINDETCKTLVQTLVISQLDYGNGLLYNISLSDKLPTTSEELCCTSDDTLVIRNIYKYNASFVPAALAFCMLQITVQDPISNNTVSNQHDQKV